MLLFLCTFIHVKHGNNILAYIHLLTYYKKT